MLYIESSDYPHSKSKNENPCVCEIQVHSKLTEVLYTNERDKLTPYIPADGFNGSIFCQAMP